MTISVVARSVTRFGKILPLWQNFKNLWPFIEGLNIILNIIWQLIYAIKQILFVVNDQILIKPYGHTGGGQRMNEKEMTGNIFRVGSASCGTQLPSFRILLGELGGG